MKTISTLNELQEFTVEGNDCKLQNLTYSDFSDIITVKYDGVSITARDYELEKIVNALKGLGCEIEYKKPVRLIDDENKFLHFLKNHNELIFCFVRNKFFEYLLRKDGYQLIEVELDSIENELSVEFDFEFLNDIPLNEDNTFEEIGWGEE